MEKIDQLLEEFEFDEDLVRIVNEADLQKVAAFTEEVGTLMDKYELGIVEMALSSLVIQQGVENILRESNPQEIKSAEELIKAINNMG